MSNVMTDDQSSNCKTVVYCLPRTVVATMAVYKIDGLPDLRCYSNQKDLSMQDHASFRREKYATLGGKVRAGDHRGKHMTSSTLPMLSVHHILYKVDLLSIPVAIVLLSFYFARGKFLCCLMPHFVL